MRITTAVTQLNWASWVRGIIGAFISGGGGAIGAGTAANWLDKNHDINIFALMGITFVVSGVISLGKFLQTEPLPQEKIEPL